MIRPRRFVYNAEADCVEEVQAEPIGLDFGTFHERAHQDYLNNRAGKAEAYRQATLERAERREFAHKRYGTESRWRE